MTLEVWFWIIFVLSLVFGVGASWKQPRTPASWAPLVVYILIFLLGWAVFGGPIKG